MARPGLVLAVALGFCAVLAGISWQARGSRRAAVSTRHYESVATAEGDAAPGAGPPGGDIFSIAIDPQTPTTVYAAAADSLYKSVDGGRSWRRIKRLPVNELPAISLDPTNPSHLFVHGSAGQILRTTDGGESRQSVDGNSPGRVA